MADVRAVLPLAAGVVACVALAGCGRGGNDAATTTTAAPPLTHRQLISRGNQVCIDTDRAVTALGQPVWNGSYWGKYVPLSRSALEKMAKLRPPVKDKGRFDEMLRLARQEVAAIADIRDLVDAGKLAQAQNKIRVATALDTKVKFAARDVGFGFCSQLISNWPA
jgi:hypothetical protein